MSHHTKPQCKPCAAASIFAIVLQLTAAIAADRHYVLDGAGRMIGVVDTGGTVVTYTYDPAGNRLTRATITGQQPNSVWALIPDTTSAGTIFDTTVAGDGLSAATGVTFQQPGLAADLRGVATNNTLPIRVSVGPAVPPGAYPFTVHRSAGGDLSSGGVSLLLSVQGTLQKPAIQPSPNPLTLSAGQSLSLVLTVPSPAPAGGLEFEASSSAPGLVTTPSWILLPAGAASVALPVTGVAVGQATITAARAGFQTGIGPVTVQPLGPPSIATLSRSLSFSGQTLTGFVVQGHNLINATFAPDRLGISFSQVVLDPSGYSATMSFNVDANAAGTFVVVATNPAGSSPAVPNPAPTPVNTVLVIDAGADDDGDGLNNGEEIAYGSDPFDAGSRPFATFVAAPASILGIRAQSVQGSDFDTFVAAPPSIRVLRAQSIQGATKLSTFVARPPITVTPASAQLSAKPSRTDSSVEEVPSEGQQQPREDRR